MLAQIEWNVGDDMYDFVDDTPKRTPVPQADEGQAGSAPTDGVVVELINDFDDELATETRHTGEFSMDLHGESHPDALYRAAGGESVLEGSVDGQYTKQQVLFGCPCCGRTVGRVIRVRPTTESSWQAVCAMCAAATLDKHPEALVGGCIRSSRRRRRTQRSIRDAG